jgi:hypothetical protein
MLHRSRYNFSIETISLRSGLIFAYSSVKYAFCYLVVQITSSFSRGTLNFFSRQNTRPNLVFKASSVAALCVVHLRLPAMAFISFVRCCALSKVFLTALSLFAYRLNLAPGLVLLCCSHCIQCVLRESLFTQICSIVRSYIAEMHGQ